MTDGEVGRVVVWKEETCACDNEQEIRNSLDGLNFIMLHIVFLCKKFRRGTLINCSL